MRRKVVQGQVRPIPRRSQISRVSEANMYAKDWFQVFCTRFGDFVPHKNEVWLAACTFKEVFQRYVGHCSQQSHMRPLSLPQFNVIRASNFPSVRLRPHKDFFRCDVCDSLERTICSSHVSSYRPIIFVFY